MTTAVASTSSGPARALGAAPKDRWLWPVLLLLGLHAGYYFPRVVDDLFISLRYAENLASGHGIVFNPGERVEGYSSPLWLLLQTVGFLLGAEPVTFSKLLGLGSLVAIVLGVRRFAQQVLALSALPTACACLFVVLDSYVVNWALLGLETPLYLALLVWYPVWLTAYVREPSRAHALWAGGTTLALAITRPEAPLYIAAVALLELVTPPRASEQGSALAHVRARFRLGVRLALPVLGLLALLWVARRLYFGLWLPHTYYAKGANSGFDLAKLAPLWEQGVGELECLLYVGGCLLALLAAFVQRAPSLLAIMGSALFFTASVELDWMPSLRHLLPVTIFAPLAWAWAAQWALGMQWRAWAIALSAPLMLVVVGAGLQVALVEVRFSPDDHHGGRPWALPKSAAKLEDTWLAMRRLEPPHVAAMGNFEMGMITQNYYVLEASSAPLENSWFVGRDIGKVGFYTGVRVFDTPGLFTPAVVQNQGWRADRSVDAALLRSAFADRPVAAQLFGPWSARALGDLAVLRDYERAAGGAGVMDLVQRTSPPPASDEVLRRYRSSLAKFPGWFYLSTLYGESVGAAMHKRVRVVEEALAQQTRRDHVESAPEGGPGHGAMLGEAAQLLGCRTTPQPVRVGQELRVVCYLRVLAPLATRFLFFQHIHDASGHGFNADHPPVAGLKPTTRWQPGELIRDAMRIRVPPVPPGEYQLYVGMWRGAERLPVTPASAHDGKHRIPAGAIRIEP